MRLNKTLLLLSIVFISSNLFGQLKGRSKHLPGTWIYEQGSGYEVWKATGSGLSGVGYRTNKIGDTVQVETLGIKEVNGQSFYTLETGSNPNGNFSAYKKYQFISKRRKLDFINIENTIPYEIKYKFGFFNKSKMVILIYMHEDVKRTKLVLHKKSA
jgi:hypothetical protein